MRDTVTYHARHAHSQTIQRLHSHLDSVRYVVCAFVGDREELD